jgi:hypothetical protein
MAYFAVEIRQNEPERTVLEDVVRTAHRLALKFSQLEFLDRVKLGSMEFLRLRVKGDVPGLLDALHFEVKRGVIGQEGAGFSARFNGRKGTVSASMMLAVARQPVTFRGPGAPHWDRQFNAN